MRSGFIQVRNWFEIEKVAGKLLFLYVVTDARLTFWKQILELNYLVSQKTKILELEF